MMDEKRPKFTVISNNSAEQQTKPKYDSGYQTNPFYERLVKFANDKQRKRFTVEDLLR